MKKKLVISILTLASINITAVAQSSYLYSLKKERQIVKNVDLKNVSFNFVNSIPKKNTNNKSLAVSEIPLGSAPNAFGTGFSGRTQLWADPTINTIALIHRSNDKVTGDPGVGSYRFDYSKDGGATWFKDRGPAYISSGNNATPFADARYPQGAIYNPTGNTEPDSAYIAYFGPSLAGTNGTSAQGAWGGHIFGSVQISGELQNRQNEEINSRYLIPDGFILTKAGTIFVSDAASDENQLNGTSIGYKDSIFISKGIWNSSSRDFDYTEKKIRVPMSKDNKGFANYGSSNRITFGDDGQTGYLTLTGHTDFAFETDSLFYIVVYKTTDGGTTWNGPTNVKLHSVKSLFPSVTTNKFTAWTDHDAVVDKDNNLHIILPVSAHADNTWTFSRRANEFAIMDINTTDGGTTWYGKILAFPQTFTGTFGVSNTDANNPSIRELNRAQASRNYTGDKLFFTWFDTDTLSFPSTNLDLANNQPNAHYIGYDVNSNKWTTTKNTSNEVFSGYCIQGLSSYYVFNYGNTHEIPLAFVEFDQQDLLKTGLPVLFKYVKGLTFTDSEFTAAGGEILLDPNATGINEQTNQYGLKVTSCFPNPSTGITNINFTLNKTTEISVEVTNAIGQKVWAAENKQFNAGENTINIDASTMPKGIYFYTLRAAEFSITNKLMIK